MACDQDGWTGSLQGGSPTRSQHKANFSVAEDQAFAMTISIPTTGVFGRAQCIATSVYYHPSSSPK